MVQGWIKLYRGLLDKSIWQCSTPEQKNILITILLLANHEENEWEWKGKKYIVKPGQFITSLEKIAEKSGKGISIQNVRTAIKKFEKHEFLTNESTNKNRLITVVNWRLYQKKEEEPTGNLTGDQQAVNKQLTTNKNDKNVNNEKKNNYMSDSNEYRLAEYLYKHILKNNLKAKEPNLEKWAKTFDYILRIDKRELDEVKNLIVFCQEHSFWYKNILSPDKLRKQYDRLVLEMNGEKGKDKKNNCNDWLKE
ncbi:hypothetical protein AL714_07790 [Clostridium botulinum]|nr:hypothetical protein AL713_18300 [Clostridium botulinum]OPD37513.1 hypothetical protein AL714_07790 [Clostridium botulinum]